MKDIIVVVIGLYLILNFSISYLVIKYNFKTSEDKIGTLLTAFYSLFIGVPWMYIAKRGGKNDNN